MNRTQKQIKSLESELADVREQLCLLFSRVEKIAKIAKRWENR